MLILGNSAQDCLRRASSSLVLHCIICIVSALFEMRPWLVYIPEIIRWLFAKQLAHRDHRASHPHGIHSMGRFMGTRKV